mgnify:CR=1 FL=1
MEFTTFLSALDEALADFPPEEHARIREFYSELYYDAVENGKSEEEAVAALGSIGEIREKALMDIGQGEAVTEPQPVYAPPPYPYGAQPPLPSPPKKSNAGKILFWSLFPFILIIGIPLAAAALVLYLAVWILLASLWIVVAAMAFAMLWGSVSSVVMMATSVPAGLFQLGTAIFAGGCGVLLGVASLKLCVLFAKATAAMTRGLGSLFHKRES